jgi:prephenate dehydrogenase
VTVPRRVLVAGAGLIGTSVALALRASGADVWVSDRDQGTARLAAELGAGGVVPDLREAKGLADVAVLAMPPAAVAASLAFAQEHGVADVYTDVASVKGLPVRRARELGCDLTSYVPGHPLAGRERHGPAAARADLFLGRTWALCPLAETSAAAVEAVTSLVVACGADPVTTDADTHDRWVALISHAPHLVAAAMAARLAPPAVPVDALKLAGQGLRDVTRVAAGDTALWTEILLANPGPVAEVVAAVADDLAKVARALDISGGSGGRGERGAGVPHASRLSPRASGAAETSASDVASGGVTGLLDRGRAGVARIPGKHGGQPRNFTLVQVVIPDQPGELARLFHAAGAAGVNIEDVRIEHSPGLPVGVAELSVRPDQAAALLDAMEAGGWPVRR